jgi:hypothetical protein
LDGSRLTGSLHAPVTRYVRNRISERKTQNGFNVCVVRMDRATRVLM